MNIYLHIHTHTTAYKVDEESVAQRGVSPDPAITEIPMGPWYRPSLEDALTQYTTLLPLPHKSMKKANFQEASQTGSHRQSSSLGQVIWGPSAEIHNGPVYR